VANTPGRTHTLGGVHLWTFNFAASSGTEIVQVGKSREVYDVGMVYTQAAAPAAVAAVYSSATGEVTISGISVGGAGVISVFTN
jgi:hypothetical protein